VQDLPETDLLLARDYAAHEGGFAAAMKALGRPAPALYHLDATRPETPRAHFGRGNRPRGACARQQSALGPGHDAPRLSRRRRDHRHHRQSGRLRAIDGQVPAHLFDLCFDATLGQSDIVAFMDEANPAALEQLRALCRSGRGGAVGHAAQLHRRSTGGSAMNAPYDPLVKGWCPGALRPMLSGDGLVRVRAYGGA
jgi:hypothetical protein